MEKHDKSSGGKVYFVSIVYVFVLGAVFFFSAGSTEYWEAWVYCSILLAQAIFQITYFLHNNPEFIRRRSKRETEPVQKRIMASLFLLQLAGYIIAGLDYRYRWSAVPVWLILAAAAVVLLGGVFLFYIFRENSYASSAIQVETEQQVIMTGPYALVRHPMYLEMMLVNLVTPLALGSYWAFIPFLLTLPLIILRLRKEEQLLLRDLAGYKEYCLKTPHRLLPLIW